MEDTINRSRLHRLAVWVLAGAAMTFAGSITLHVTQAAAPGDDPGDRPAGQGDRRPDAPPGDRQNRDSADAGPRGDRPPPGPPGLQRALDSLDLTAEQKQKIDPIVEDFHQQQQQARESFLKRMKESLTPEQYSKLESAMMRPPGNRPMRDGGSIPGAGRDATAPENARTGRDSNAPENSRPSRRADNKTAEESSGAKPDASLGVPVTLTGGFDTDSRDHGRPVILIASALDVSADVFRKAFSFVTPASGGRQPEPAQVNLNKQALLRNLGPYGVTNDWLDTVSNFYRYSASKGEMWRHTPAVVYATVHNGAVTGFTIATPGAGYSSAPTVSIAGMENVNAIVALSFGVDLAKNGSIKEITIRP
ncbi:MAG TPA: hypothetical protein VG326_14650 [Tepidisphaeraceae bacterium]|jgi:Spy/CpxP family protein refolding chaperone|nr:hypothetical protein [Tepidisphaeraceae bacterium]